MYICVLFLLNKIYHSLLFNTHTRGYLVYIGNYKITIPGWYLQPRKRPLLLKILNPPKQELQLPIPRTRSVLRDLMTRIINRAERKTTLRMRRSEDTSPGIRIPGYMSVTISQTIESSRIRHEQGSDRRLLEPLRTIPSHVLDRREGSICEEQVIKPAMADEDVIRCLDDAGEWAEGTGGWKIAVGEEISAADFVVCWGDVEGFLYGGAVEVVVWSAG